MTSEEIDKNPEYKKLLYAFLARYSYEVGPSESDFQDAENCVSIAIQCWGQQTKELQEEIEKLKEALHRMTIEAGYTKT